MDNPSKKAYQWLWATDYQSLNVRVSCVAPLFQKTKQIRDRNVHFEEFPSVSQNTFLVFTFHITDIKEGRKPI